MPEIAKAYDASSIEKKWYVFWKEGGFFRAEASSQKPSYCIGMPPPNVTGVLHMGHALVNTLQDILIRWKRMQGYEVLWVPGTDHAGIATQTVVERNLIAKTGKRRKDFSREEFLQHVWAWKEESEKHILEQLQRLGCSCDWSRLVFTMDKERNLAVQTLFKKLFDQGLIYRGNYLVNWDPVTQTALADDEVEYEEKHSFLWYIRYPLEEGSGYLVVATTRPETLLGDTAVAVSPEDSRYSHLVGKKLKLPLTNRFIPVIADSRIDPTFGTGAVKVTPAHDFQDYEIALTHNLPLLTVMTPDGKISAEGGEFSGLTREEAREAIVQRLEKLQLIEKIEPHLHRVGVSYRSKAVIEPYLSKQWFVRMSHFKPTLLQIVREKKTKLIPSSWESTYFYWIENLRDWCISRQLWWGHRIPIWYHKDNPEKILCATDTEIPLALQEHPEEWVQDEDVLDTWFSSALWPFSMLGWPQQKDVVEKFYPNATLITGHDILFFWVARMLLMGEYTMGEVPFKEVFLHGLIYGKSYWRQKTDGSIAYVDSKERLEYDLGKPIPTDLHSKWEKMSKSKGNVIDPIEILKTYGTDAMRMALCASATHARQIDLDRRRFEEYKNFANKVWNGARFVFIHLETLSPEQLSQGLDKALLSLEDKWILSLLTRTIQEVTQALENYAFDKAATAAYEFFWKEFCAYYLELTKPILFGKVGSLQEKENKQKILAIVLCNVIRLMHPMVPFITEELFAHLYAFFPAIKPLPSCDPYTQETLQALHAKACIIAPYPQVLCPEDRDAAIEEHFSFLGEIVHAIRTIRAEMQLAPNQPITLFLSPHSSAELKEHLGIPLIQKNENILRALVKIETITYLPFEAASQQIPFAAHKIVGAVKLLIPLPPELEHKEKERLLREQEKLSSQKEILRKQLANPEFLQKAPPPLVEKNQNQLEQVTKELAVVQEKLTLFTTQ